MQLQNPRARGWGRDVTALNAIRDVDSDAARQVLNDSVDVEVSRPIWTRRLEDASEEARALVERAAQLDGPVGDMARDLLADRGN